MRRGIEDKNDYERDRMSVEEFARSASQLVPNIEPFDLTLSYSGIRAELTPSPAASLNGLNSGIVDFIIERDPEFPQVIHLIGIESPGLTSAPSIAEQVVGMAADILG
jgi:glycerol-3-phosphate dehydrogenase